MYAELTMESGKQIENILKSIPSGVKLIAVTKTHPVEVILQAYKSGHKIFGENKVQEMIQKYQELPKDIEWHLIGHLQTNKVKFAAPFVSMIHSVDSQKLLQVINTEADKNSRIIDCLLQVRIAREETKFGLSYEELKSILKNVEIYQNIRICGLMGMATFTDDENIIRSEFKRCKEIFEEIKNLYFYNVSYFKEISMGMSDDYLIAIEEGSTMVRIGSKIFGQRNYT